MSNLAGGILNTTYGSEDEQDGCIRNAGCGGKGLPEVEVVDGECRCPYCNRVFGVSSRQDQDRLVLMCYRCGHRWASKTGEPRRCPACGSYAWNRPAVECSCRVCGYTWIARSQGRPSRCPNCKSNRWDEDPKAVDRVIEEEDPEVVTRRWVLARYHNGGGCLEIASELGLPLFRVMSIVSEDMKVKLTPRL